MGDIVLRPRQAKAIHDLRAAYRTGKHSPILVAPTGFGKTATTVVMIRAAIEKGLRVWFMAHLKEILNDTSKRLTAAGIPHGFIWAEHLSDRRRNVQVVSVQTAARRLSRLERPDLIIVDEAHLAVAATYQEVFDWAKAGPKFYAPGGAKLLHLTATPQRLDGRGMCEVADAIVPTCSTMDLINEGLLKPVKYLTPDTPDMSGVRSVAGDFSAAGASAIMTESKIIGSALDHYMSLGRGRPGIGFCVDIKSAREYAERFSAAGLRCMAISGDDDDAERERALHGIRTGQLDFVFNCKLWIAGVDASSIAYIADLAPTMSLTRYLQGIGRGLRVDPVWKDLMYADHAGNLARHGNPLAAREWSLQGDERQRGKGERNEVSEKKCPNCFASVKAAVTICPHCLHQFEVRGREVEEVDGTLTMVDLGVQAPPAQEAWERQVERARASTLDDLIALGKRRGYKRPELWARHVYRARLAKQQQDSARVV